MHHPGNQSLRAVAQGAVQEDGPSSGLLQTATLSALFRHARRGAQPAVNHQVLPERGNS